MRARSRDQVSDREQQRRANHNGIDQVVGVESESHEYVSASLEVDTLRIEITVFSFATPKLANGPAMRVVTIETDLNHRNLLF
jgi:hypothetical protein